MSHYAWENKAINKQNVAKLSKADAHFYASSIGVWKANTNLLALIYSMKENHMDFVIWYVPLSIKSAYDVKEFVPNVKNAIAICSFKWTDQWELDGLNG